MAYIDESLSTGEEISTLFRLHWITRMPMVAWLLLGLVTFGLTWLVAAYEYLRLRHVEQGVTNKRVIYKTGIISRKSEEMKLASIETVEIDQGVLGRMLGYGTVKSPAAAPAMCGSAALTTRWRSSAPSKASATRSPERPSAGRFTCTMISAN